MKPPTSLTGLFSKEGFAGQSALLAMGTAMGQLFPLLALPFLGRLYNEQAFGVYGLYTAALGLTTQLCCLKYDMALPLCNQEEVGPLFALCLGASGVCGLFLLPLSFWGAGSGGGGGSWLWLLPVSTALVGIHTTLVGLNLRLGRLKAIALSTAGKALAMVVLQLLLAPLQLGGIALVLGQTGAYLVGNMGLVKGVRPLLHGATAKGVFQTAKAYRAFPLYTLPGSLAGSGVFSLITYLLAACYGQEALGYYSMVSRVLFTPVGMVSGAVGQAYLKAAGQNKQAAKGLFTRLTKALFLLPLPAWAVLFVFANPLLVWVLGEHWAPAIPLLRLLIPLAAIRLVVVPISATPVILSCNRLFMVWQLGLLGGSLLPAVAWGIWGISLPLYLGLWSALVGGGYLCLYVISRHLLGRIE